MPGFREWPITPIPGGQVGLAETPLQFSKLSVQCPSCCDPKEVLGTSNCVLTKQLAQSAQEKGR